MLRPRLFDSRLTPRERRVYGAVLAWFVLVGVALIWPVYSWFAGALPLVLGMPLSLFYLVALLAASFLVVLALFVWEGRREGAAGTGPREDGSEGGS